MKGKTRREGEKEGERKGRRKVGEGHWSIMKSNGAGVTTLEGEVRDGLSKEALEMILRLLVAFNKYLFEGRQEGMSE